MELQLLPHHTADLCGQEATNICPHLCQEVIVFYKYVGSESVLTSILHVTVVVLGTGNIKPVLFVLPHSLHKRFQII
jgi:hypothetical protein